MYWPGGNFMCMLCRQTCSVYEGRPGLAAEVPERSTVHAKARTCEERCWSAVYRETCVWESEKSTMDWETHQPPEQKNCVMQIGCPETLRKGLLNNHTDSGWWKVRGHQGQVCKWLNHRLGMARKPSLCKQVRSNCDQVFSSDTVWSFAWQIFVFIFKNSVTVLLWF